MEPVTRTLNALTIEAHEKAYFTLLSFSGDLDSKSLFHLSRLFHQLLQCEIKEYIFDLTIISHYCQGAVALIRNFLVCLERVNGRLLFLNRKPDGTREMQALFGGQVRCFENEMDLEDFIIRDDRLVDTRLFRTK